MCRVVVIDDDPAFVDLAGELLKDRDWEVVACTEGDRALQCVEEAQPDVILLDVRLDLRLSGWDILDALKATPATAAIPVIVCSAASDELHAHHAWLSEQGIMVLSKPFDIDDMYRHVEGALLSAAHQRGDR